MSMRKAANDAWLDSLVQSIKARLASHPHKAVDLTDVADHVVQQGTATAEDTAWRYRIWGSGLTECWGHYEGNSYSMTASPILNAWYQHNIYMRLPVSFDSTFTPQAFASVNGDGVNLMGHITPGALGVGIVYHCSLDDMAVSADIYIVGHTGGVVEPGVYPITCDRYGVSAAANNPNTIEEGGTATLTFTRIRDRLQYVRVTGAESTYVEDGNIITVNLFNPTGWVTVSISAENI